MRHYMPWSNSNSIFAQNKHNGKQYVAQPLAGVLEPVLR